MKNILLSILSGIFLSSCNSSLGSGAVDANQVNAPTDLIQPGFQNSLLYSYLPLSKSLKAIECVQAGSIYIYGTQYRNLEDFSFVEELLLFSSLSDCNLKANPYQRMRTFRLPQSYVSNGSNVENITFKIVEVKVSFFSNYVATANAGALYGKVNWTANVEQSVLNTVQNTTSTIQFIYMNFGSVSIGSRMYEPVK